MRELHKLEGYAGTTPVINFGKHVSAFTIENYSFIEGSSAIKISPLRTFFSFVANPFRQRVSSLEAAKEIALRYAIARLRIDAKKADYIVNLKVKFHNIGKYSVFVHVYATALYMYEDTLPLFNFTNYYRDFKTVNAKKVLTNAAISFAIIVGIVISLSFLDNALSRFLINNFSIANEEIIWSYIKDEALENPANTNELKLVEDQLNELVKKVPYLYSESRYPIKVYIVNEPYTDIVSYPNGAIAVYADLLNKVKSQDLMLYLLAHEVYHIIQRDYLKELDKGIVNLYLIMNIFGKDSFFGRIYFDIEKFWDLTFDIDSEISATKFALDVLNENYGNIGGYYEYKQLFGSLGSEYQDYLSRHPENPKLLLDVQNYIHDKNYQNGSTLKTVFVKPIKNNTDVINQGHTLNDEFMMLFDAFKSESGEQMLQYQKYLTDFSGIIEFREQVTKEDLEQRYAATFEIQRYINLFEDNFVKLVNKHDKAIKAYLDKVNDQGKKVVLNNLWDEEKSSMIAQVRFFVRRDYEVIGVKQAILNFLIKRVGTFNVVGAGLQFSSATARDQYLAMVGQISELLRKEPPIKSNRY